MGRILGDKRFARRQQTRLEKKAAGEAVHRPRRELTAYFAKLERDAAIVAAFRDGGYTQTAIAEIAGLSVSRVSRILAQRRAAQGISAMGDDEEG